MSIQTKKGFTLIELMVVIVIIGILAAIAIPKLFGMSAKAKASEVGPAASTWVKLQLAYIMEQNSGPGDNTDIGYSLPGDANGKTANFKYSASATSGWTAAADIWVNSVTGCSTNSAWTVAYASAGTEGTGGGSFTASPGCKTLTPTFDKINESF